jgi:hypothetical protein
VRLNNSQNWRETHLNQLERCYRGAPGFDEIFPELREVYSFAGDRMVDFNLHALGWLMDKFGVSISMVLSTALAPRGASNEMLVDLLAKVGATDYISGIGARDYYNPGPFESSGIKVLWQDFTHPVYQQRHGEFVSFLSSLDVLLNCGVTKSREILRSCL